MHEDFYIQYLLYEVGARSQTGDVVEAEHVSKLYYTDYIIVLFVYYYMVSVIN